MVKRRGSSSWAFFLPFIAIIIAFVSGPPIAAYAVAPTTTTSGITSSPSPSGAAVVEPQEEDDIINNHNLDKFYIHGWRWHTLSLGRDARRLAHLATTHYRAVVALQKQEKEEDVVVDMLSISNLQKATDHTVNFNMKGLHRIESEVFFPWVRQKVVHSILSLMNDNSFVATQQQQQKRRLIDAMDRLEQNQRRLHELGRALVSE
jgi:hypothetical protein